MAGNDFLQAEERYKSAQKLLTIGFMAMVLINGFQAYYFSSALGREKTHVIPLTLPGEIWLTRTDASEAYLGNMGLYVSSLLGNVTASNAESQFKKFLEICSNKAHSDARAYLKKMHSEIQDFATVSYGFQWNGAEIDVDRDLQEIRVEGFRSRIVGRTVAKKDRLTLIIPYEIRHGRFEITEVPREVVQGGGSNDS